MKALTAVLLLSHYALALPNANLLENYLRWQRLKIVVIFHCVDQNDDILHLSQRMSSFNVKIHYVNISNLTAISLNQNHTMRYDYHELGATVDMRCSETAQFFELISPNGYFNSSYHWLLVNDTVDSASCLLAEQNLNVDAKVTLIVPKDSYHGEVYDVFDVYRTMKKHDTRLNVTLMGNWSVVAGFSFGVTQTEYERRWDFGGIWLKASVTALNQVHHTTLLKVLTSNDPVDRYALHRFGYRMWEFVMRKHNFTIKLILTPSWGLGNEDGHSDVGVIGQVTAKKADLAINALSYTVPRVAAFDYTITIGVSRMLLVFRHPRNSHVRNIFLQPFRINLWIGVLAVNIVAAVILFLNFCAEAFKAYYDREVHDNRGLAVLTVLGILCQQGFATKTLFSSTRITLFSTLIFSILINQFYSTYIVGYLLITPPKTMKTLKHLLDSDLKVIVEDLAYNVDYLNRTKDPVAVELYSKKILNGENNFLNVTEGIARVRLGGYAFQCDTAYAYPLVRNTFTDQEICDLQEIYLNPIRPMQLVLPKGSPFKEMFRITLRKTVETAAAQYQQKRFFSDKLKCAKNELESMAVDLDHVSTLFFGLYFSVVGCFGLLLIELVHYNLFRRQKDQRKLKL